MLEAYLLNPVLPPIALLGFKKISWKARERLLLHLLCLVSRFSGSIGPREKVDLTSQCGYPSAFVTVVFCHYLPVTVDLYMQWCKIEYVYESPFLPYVTFSCQDLKTIGIPCGLQSWSWKHSSFLVSFVSCCRVFLYFSFSTHWLHFTEKTAALTKSSHLKIWGVEYIEVQALPRGNFASLFSASIVQKSDWFFFIACDFLFSREWSR